MAKNTSINTGTAGMGVTVQDNSSQFNFERAPDITQSMALQRLFNVQSQNLAKQQQINQQEQINQENKSYAQGMAEQGQKILSGDMTIPDPATTQDEFKLAGNMNVWHTAKQAEIDKGAEELASSFEADPEKLLSGSYKAELEKYYRDNLAGLAETDPINAGKYVKSLYDSSLKLTQSLDDKRFKLEAARRKEQAMQGFGRMLSKGATVGEISQFLQSASASAIGSKEAHKIVMDFAVSKAVTENDFSLYDSLKAMPPNADGTTFLSNMAGYGLIDSFSKIEDMKQRNFEKLAADREKELKAREDLVDGQFRLEIADHKLKGTLTDDVRQSLYMRIMSSDDLPANVKASRIMDLEKQASEANESSVIVNSVANGPDEYNNQRAMGNFTGEAGKKVLAKQFAVNINAIVNDKSMNENLKPVAVATLLDTTLKYADVPPQITDALMVFSEGRMYDKAGKILVNPLQGLIVETIMNRPDMLDILNKANLSESLITKIMLTRDVAKRDGQSLAVALGRVSELQRDPAKRVQVERALNDWATNSATLLQEDMQWGPGDTSLFSTGSYNPLGLTIKDPSARALLEDEARQAGTRTLLDNPFLSMESVARRAQQAVKKNVIHADSKVLIYAPSESREGESLSFPGSSAEEKKAVGEALYDMTKNGLIKAGVIKEDGWLENKILTFDLSNKQYITVAVPGLAERIVLKRDPTLKMAKSLVDNESIDVSTLSSTAESVAKRVFKNKPDVVAKIKNLTAYNAQIDAGYKAGVVGNLVNSLSPLNALDAVKGLNNLVGDKDVSPQDLQLFRDELNKAITASASKPEAQKLFRGVAYSIKPIAERETQLAKDMRSFMMPSETLKQGGASVASKYAGLLKPLKFTAEEESNLTSTLQPIQVPVSNRDNFEKLKAFSPDLAGISLVEGGIITDGRRDNDGNPLYGLSVNMGGKSDSFLRSVFGSAGVPVDSPQALEAIRRGKIKITHEQGMQVSKAAFDLTYKPIVDKAISMAKVGAGRDQLTDSQVAALNIIAWNTGNPQYVAQAYKLIVEGRPSAIATMPYPSIRNVKGDDAVGTKTRNRILNIAAALGSNRSNMYITNQSVLPNPVPAMPVQKPTAPVKKLTDVKPNALTLK